MKLKNFARLRVRCLVIDGGFIVAITIAMIHLTDLLIGQDLAEARRNGSVYYVALAAVILTYALNKDIVNGRSIGKTLTNFRIVTLRDGGKPGPWRCLVRNLPSLIVPLEAIMLLIGHRTPGDYLVNTQVDEAPENYELRSFSKNLFFGRLLVVTTTFVVVFLVLLMIYDAMHYAI